jgi:uncharacterized protein YndB with AHSA1/START domain
MTASASAAGRGTRSAKAAVPSRPVLTIKRVFDAPRELVWQAWCEPELAARWWAPEGLCVVVLEMDVRPGGAWRKCMRAPDGTDYWRSGVYREVVPPERLVFTYVTDDPHGRPGLETLVTVTFAERGARTFMTFRQTGFDTAASRDAHRGGWRSSLERLARHLPRAESTQSERDESS